MIYEFEAPDGSVVCLEYRMGKAPKIGASITRGGVRLTRLPPRPQLDVDNECKNPMTSWQFPPYWGRRFGHEKFDSLGNHVFTTKRERREFVAKVNGGDKTAKLTWDGKG